MNNAEVERRLKEEESEAACWINVLALFSHGDFEALKCPHCGAAKKFEYLVHPHGFTLRCRECSRFVHGSGERPSWLSDSSQETKQYRPVPGHE